VSAIHPESPVLEQNKLILKQLLSFAVITVAVLLLVVIAGLYLFHGTYARRVTVMGCLVLHGERGCSLFCVSRWFIGPGTAQPDL
jgi:hypothetical protein